MSIPGGVLAGRRVAVLGLGVMGRGIARVFAAAGADVVATDATPELLASNAELLAREIAADGDTRTPRTVAGLEECVAGASVVVEAVSERPDVKAELLAQLADVLAPDTVLATNTSSLSVSDLGRQYGRPTQVVGMHFFNPATKMRLVEVVRGAETAPETVDLALRICADLGKEGVLCVDSPGFIVNRCCRPIYYESQLLYSQGVEPAAVDALARRALGHRMGPLETIDITGLHTHLVASETALREFGDPRYRPIPVVRRLVRSGFLGRSTNRGFYDYGSETPGAGRTRVTRVPEAAPLPLRAAGPDGDRIAGLAGPASGGDVVTVYRTSTSTDDDLRAIEEFRVRGAVVLDSSDGGWIERLPAGVDWVHVHQREGEVTVEVVSDELAGVAPTEVVDGVVAALGGVAVVVPALPGLVVDRLGNALANEACGLVEEGIATAEGVDAALVSGMNHARGPFAYMAAVGADQVLHGLRRLQDTTGDDRYRPTAHLTRLVAGAARRRSGA